MKIALRIFGSILALAVLLVAGSYGWIQTGGGKTWLAHEISTVASSDESRIAVSDITGSVPFHISVGSVALADKEGTWLTIRNARLDVSAMALFSRRLHIQAVEASEIDVARLPQSGAPKPKTGSNGFPHLPFTIELDELLLPRVALEAPVLGSPALLALRAHANVKPKSADLALDLARGDGVAGHAAIALDYDIDAHSIALNADVAEPTGQLADLALHREDHLPISVTLNGAGPTGGWKGALRARLGRTASLDAALSLGMDASGQAYAVSATLNDSGLLPDNLRALAQPAHLSANAAHKGAVWTVSPMSLIIPAGEASLTGSFDEEAKTVDGTLKVESDRLEWLHPVVSPITGGALSLNATARGHLDAISLSLEGSLSHLLVEGVPPELTRTVSLDAAAVVEGNGEAVTLDHATLGGSGLHLTLSGSRKAGSMSGHLTGDVADLAVFDALAGEPLSGRVALTADVVQSDGDMSGSLAAKAQKLALGPVGFDSLDLAVKLPSLAGRKGDVDATFVRSDLAGSLKASIARPDETTLTISDLVLKAKGTSLKGDLRVDTTRKRASGNIVLSVPDLNAWSAVAGKPLQGKVDAAVSLTAAQGQDVRAELHGTGLAYGADTVATADASGALRDVTAAPAGQARVEIDGLHAGTAVLDKTTLNAGSIKPGMWRLDAGTAGTVNHPVVARLSGTIGERADALTLVLSSVAAKFDQLAIDLRSPFTISKHGQAIRTNRLSLGLGSGIITGFMSLTPASVDARVQTSPLSIAELGKALSKPGCAGTAQLSLSLAGKPNAPEGKADLTLAKFNYDTATPQAAANLISADLHAALSSRLARVNGTMSAGQGLHLKLAGSVPASLSLSPFAFDLPREAPVSADITGAGKFAELANSLPIGEDQVAGTLSLDAHVHGTLAAPAYSGHLLVQDGSYVSRAYGTVLRNVAPGSRRQ